MAHHVAELLIAARSAKGRERVDAEDRAARAIQQLWARDIARLFLWTRWRRIGKLQKCWPPSTLPTTGTLSGNRPDSSTRASLSLEVFDLASRLALVGLMELLPRTPAKVAAAAQDALSVRSKTFSTLFRRPTNSSRRQLQTTRKSFRLTSGNLTDLEGTRSQLLQSLQSATAKLAAVPALVSKRRKSTRKLRPLAQTDKAKLHSRQRAGKPSRSKAKA
jgi:hypothetical protein